MKILDKLFRSQKGLIDIKTSTPTDTTLENSRTTYYSNMLLNAKMKKLWKELDGSSKGLILFHIAGYTMCGFMLLGGRIFGQLGWLIGIIVFYAIYAMILVICDLKRKKLVGNDEN